jgi:hypothetical protein
MKKRAAFENPFFGLPALGMKKENSYILLRMHQECLSNRHFGQKYALFWPHGKKAS